MKIQVTKKQILGGFIAFIFLLSTIAFAFSEDVQEVIQGGSDRIYFKVLNSTGGAETSATCSIDIYYYNGTSILNDSVPSNFGNGLYYFQTSPTWQSSRMLADTVCTNDEGLDEISFEFSVVDSYTTDKVNQTNYTVENILANITNTLYPLIIDINETTDQTNDTIFEEFNYDTYKDDLHIQNSDFSKNLTSQVYAPSDFIYFHGIPDAGTFPEDPFIKLNWQILDKYNVSVYTSYQFSSVNNNFLRGKLEAPDVSCDNCTLVIEAVDTEENTIIQGRSIETFNITGSGVWRNFDRRKVEALEIQSGRKIYPAKNITNSYSKSYNNKTIKTTNSINITWNITVPVKSGVSSGDILPLEWCYYFHSGFIDSATTSCVDQDDSDSLSCTGACFKDINVKAGETYITSHVFTPNLEAGNYTVYYEYRYDPDNIWYYSDTLRLDTIILKEDTIRSGLSPRGYAVTSIEKGWFRYGTSDPNSQITRFSQTDDNDLNTIIQNDTSGKQYFSIYSENIKDIFDFDAIIVLTIILGLAIIFWKISGSKLIIFTGMLVYVIYVALRMNGTIA